MLPYLTIALPHLFWWAAAELDDDSWPRAPSRQSDFLSVCYVRRGTLIRRGDEQAAALIGSSHRTSTWNVCNAAVDVLACKRPDLDGCRVMLDPDPETVLYRWCTAGYVVRSEMLIKDSCSKVLGSRSILSQQIGAKVGVRFDRQEYLRPKRLDNKHPVQARFANGSSLDRPLHCPTTSSRRINDGSMDWWLKICWNAKLWGHPGAGNHVSNGSTRKKAMRSDCGTNGVLSTKVGPWGTCTTQI